MLNLTIGTSSRPALRPCSGKRSACTSNALSTATTFPSCAKALQTARRRRFLSDEDFKVENGLAGNTPHAYKSQATDLNFV